MTAPQPLGISAERVRQALRGARSGSPARYRLTAWESRRATAGRSGLGSFRDFSTDDFVAALKDDANNTIPKGQGPCFSMGASSGGGSTDIECTARHGLTLDCDQVSDASKGQEAWTAFSLALREAGIGHVIQVRAGKFHVHIPYGEPLPIDVTHETLQPTKAEYKALMNFVIGCLEKLTTVAFDRSEANRLLGIVYAYTARTDGEVVQTFGVDGDGLDLSAFLVPFRAELAALSTAQAPSRPFVGVTDAGTYADTPERMRRVRAYLAKVPPAIDGDQGNVSTLKAAMVAYDFDLEPEEALEAMRPWNERCVPPWTEGDLFKIIQNAYRYAKGQRGSKCMALERKPTTTAATVETVDHPVPSEAAVRRKLDPSTHPLAQYKEAKEGEPGAFADERGWWIQIQPTTARLTAKVNELIKHSEATIITNRAGGTRSYRIHPSKILESTDEDGLRNALTRSCRTLMGGMEPEPRTITTAVQLLCDRARPEIELQPVRWAGEDVFALHEIPRPAPGDWSAHKEFIDRCSCPDTTMAWTWSCFLPQEQTGRESLYLYGPGNDGKSFWAEILMEFLGPAACASQVLKGENRFELANLVDRRLVYFGDTRNPTPIHPKVMREIISGAILPFERKGKDMQVAYFHPRCLFTSNVHFKIDTHDRAEYTRIRKVLVSPLKDNAGDQGWKRRLLEQFPAFLWECRKVYEAFATPGQDLPITEACHAALSDGMEAIDAAFDYLSVRLEFGTGDQFFVSKKDVSDLMDRARYQGFERVNAYKWLESRGAHQYVPNTKKRHQKKINGRTTDVWLGVRERETGAFRNVAA